MSAEVLILGSKRCTQRRLFITQDKQVKAKPDDDPVLKNREIAKEEPLTDYYRHDGNVHRVSHKPVEAVDHQMTRRENGCGCAQTFEGKAGKAVHQHEAACEDEQDSDGPKRRQGQERRLNTPARDPPW